MKDSDSSTIEWRAPRTVRVMLNLTVLLALVVAASALASWLLLGHLFELEPGIQSDLLALLIALALSHLAIGLLFDNFIDWYTERCSVLDDLFTGSDRDFFIYLAWLGFSVFVFGVFIKCYSCFESITLNVRYAFFLILLYGQWLRIPVFNFLRETQANA